MASWDGASIRVRIRASVRACERASVRACVRVCACERACVCARACVRACVCVDDLLSSMGITQPSPILLLIILRYTFRSAAMASMSLHASSPSMLVYPYLSRSCPTNNHIA